MSFLLALDSSTETLVVALTHASGPRVHESDGGARASEQMLPQARALLTEAGATLADLDAIAFAAGPGAFTGLRTACAVAQGLALGLDKPVLALDSLMLVAEDARQQGAPVDRLPVWVLMDARMDEIYAAAYQWTGAAWQALQAPALYTPAALLPLLLAQPEAVLAGNALQAFAEALAPALQRPSLWPQAASRGHALAALAEQAWQQGLHIAADEAMPVYVRDKVAQTTAERLAAKAGSA